MKTMFKKLSWALGLIIIIIIGFLIISRSMLYNYDVNADHAYDFTATEATIIPVEISGNSLMLPAYEGVGQSSFLKVEVEASLFSHVIRPSLELSGNNGSEIQYFEHGANGERYINVSKLIEAGAHEIIFEENFLSIVDGKTDLIQFENPILKDKKILILAPHPDDAEIASFGLYSEHDDIFIVTVTSGDAGSFMYDEVYSSDEAKAHYLKKGEVRTWNSLSVPMLGGVPPENLVNLGFNDARLRGMYRDKDLIASGFYTEISDMNTFRKQNTSYLAKGLEGINNWDSLVGNLVYLIGEINPDIIITPSPMFDMHSDHQYTTIAAVEALKKLNKRDGQLLLYTNHQVNFNERFPYGEMGSLISLPPTPKGSNYFRRLYSYSMSIDVQRNKIFALDAMNDLRLGTDYRFSGRAFQQAFETLWMQLTGKDESYFRRSVRSNEFFFVIEMDDIYDDKKLDKL
jgi:LmbE family N-acetylglucosaminyl deacetylase